MASAAASEMIFFIATMVIAASVVGVLGGQTLHVTQSMSQSSKGLSSMIQSNFEIINDPSNIPYHNGYVFYVKNTGTNSFFFTNASISTVINGTLLSGQYVSYASPGNSSQLLPGQVGDIVANITLAPGYYSIVVTLNNGLSKSLEFQVG
ncbi:Archaebacterial flagellin [Thermoplasmatales archaeon]|nr:Archaebacterial flagellin [Thermoplasmatales archaeon]